MRKATALLVLSILLLNFYHDFTSLEALANDECDQKNQTTHSPTTSQSLQDPLSPSPALVDTPKASTPVLTGSHDSPTPQDVTINITLQSPANESRVQSGSTVTISLSPAPAFL